MIHIPFTPLHASLLAFSGSLPEALDARYVFQIDSKASEVQYELESQLGACVLSPGPAGTLGGNCALRLVPGAYPLTHGEELAGQLCCLPDLEGSVPSRIHGHAPLLRVGLHSLALAPRSAAFDLDAHGRGTLESVFEFTAGELTLHVPGHGSLALPLSGKSSPSHRREAQVWIDGGGMHLQREFDVAFAIEEPVHDLHLRLCMHGRMQADLQLSLQPQGWPTSSHSSSDAQLVVTHGPQSTQGLFVLLDPHVPADFGSGTLQRARELLSLALVRVGVRGSAARVFELHLPPLTGPLVAGWNWAFQLGYRDPAPGSGTA